MFCLGLFWLWCCEFSFGLLLLPLMQLWGVCLWLIAAFAGWVVIEVNLLSSVCFHLLLRDFFLSEYAFPK